ncbi:hypothetical protein BDA99DRAFT_524592 [Phascolomyces articulosus]|uniref:Uncharacterized protein n=1 Tax=Phascolomyces articulosus TaxID=60185 RepID=A0AAD5JPS2_9FUNG|nr:hypothetical protein BDA99DRAFT_524592 [Phascolomyces articulosus]
MKNHVYISLVLCYVIKMHVNLLIDSFYFYTTPTNRIHNSGESNYHYLITKFFSSLFFYQIFDNGFYILYKMCVIIVENLIL